MYGLLSVKRSIWTERAGTDDSRGGGMGGGGGEFYFVLLSGMVIMDISHWLSDCHVKYIQCNTYLGA